MNNNDLIRRGDVKAKKVYCRERHEYVVPVAEIDWLPAAPRSMSAVEYERERGRFSDWCDQHDCVDCEYYEGVCPSGYRPTPEGRIEAILEWAQAHPDEVGE